ncbi:MAG: hypothetical protein ABII06_11910, partial [Pseudomonadota bacterium]
RACLQLNHAGRFAKTERPLLPSPISGSHLVFHITSLKDFMEFFPLERRFGLTRTLTRKIATWNRVMTEEEKKRVIMQFAKAAERAREAGFDMIELHGATGYLLGQFLSAFTNKTSAKDEESFKSRVAFPLAVLREVKRRLPEGFPVGFRLMLREWVPHGIDLPEAIAWARILEKEGISYLSGAVGTYNSLFTAAVRKQMKRPAYLREDLASLTRAVNVPTIISGRIVKPSLAGKLLQAGVADLIGLGRPLRVDPDWLKKAGRGETVRACLNCNTCLKRVILDQGFNCTRWPQLKQDRTDLEHKMLHRSYKSLIVVTDDQDMALFRHSIPLLFPDKRNLAVTISPTVLFLQPEEGEWPEGEVRSGFLGAVREIMNRLGFVDGQLKDVVRAGGDSYDRAVHEEALRGQHGVILIGRNPDQDWRQRLLYKERAKVMGLIGPSDRRNHVLVPVDLSSSTLLVMMFLRQTYLERKDLHVDFVHVFNGPAGPVEERWKRIKKTVGVPDDLEITLLPSRREIASVLLERIHQGRYGTVIMGKRGFSGIKRWLLGSVSAGVSRGLTDQTLFLID